MAGAQGMPIGSRGQGLKLLPTCREFTTQWGPGADSLLLERADCKHLFLTSVQGPHEGVLKPVMAGVFAPWKWATRYIRALSLLSFPSTPLLTAVLGEDCVKSRESGVAHQHIRARMPVASLPMTDGGEPHVAGHQWVQEEEERNSKFCLIQ